MRRFEENVPRPVNSEQTQVEPDSGSERMDRARKLREESRRLRKEGLALLEKGRQKKEDSNKLMAEVN